MSTITFKANAASTYLPPAPLEHPAAPHDNPRGAREPRAKGRAALAADAPRDRLRSALLVHKGGGTGSSATACVPAAVSLVTGHVCQAGSSLTAPRPRSPS